VSSLSEAEKNTYKAHAQWRRERGIRLKKIGFMAESTQVEGFFDIFETWVARWGKIDAVDQVLSSMCAAEARYQDYLEAKRAARKKKRSKDVPNPR
jgi:hypothetical protein